MGTGKAEGLRTRAVTAQPLEQLRSKKPLVRAGALEALADSDDPEAVSSLIGALDDPSPTVRSTAAGCLGVMGREEGVKPLLDKLSDRSVEVRMRAAESLGSLLAGKRCPRALLQSLRDPNELVRIEAAEALGVIGDRKALPSLWGALDDRSPLVRSYVAGAIGSVGGERDVAGLEERLRREKSDTARLGFYQALHMLGRRGVLTDLLELLHSGDYRVRCAAANILSNVAADRTDTPLVISALRKALRREPTVAARSSFRAGLRTLGSRYPRDGVRKPRRGGQLTPSS
jgi:HEAT repeat protein